MFRDRESAGQKLAERLGGYREDPSGLILALPRGGVAVGYPLCLALRLPLDVLITRKLRAPDNPEYALGAVSETGYVYLNQEAVSFFSVYEKDFKVYLDEEIRMQKQEIVRRQGLYRGGRPLPPLAERTVILVDDGIATGATFLASVMALKDLKVKRLVAAIPVGPPERIRQIGRKLDEVVALWEPEDFVAVGSHYEDFTQVEDTDVVRYLKAAEAAWSERAHLA